MASSCSAVGVPGIDTTMFLPPWVAISASETPLASMRWRMMSTAWSIWPATHLLAVLQHRLEDHLGAALEVEPEAGGRGAAAPDREAAREGAEARG